MGDASNSIFVAREESGACFCTLPVSVAPAVKQLAVPQEYPDGQHPATGPASLPHMNHPLAQVALSVGFGRPVAGMTIVAPLETMVVEGGGGHE